MIVAVGHADLPPVALELVEAELKTRLDGLDEAAAGMVRAGAGLPPAFARAVRAAGRRLVVLLPAEHSVPAVPPESDRTAARELLHLAEEVRLTPFDPVDRNARVGADERVVRSAGASRPVWDGSPSDGRDATAHLVAYGRARGIPVEVIWPGGAERMPPTRAG